MKCVDCLPLIEEFFDGEVDDKTGGQMREHMAACAECAEAFDALRAEQEMFLRYDRELEVSPALWHGVRTAIAAAETPEAKPRPRPFLTSLREQLAAALAVFAVRPALASSMALLAVGVTAGAFWYANSQRTSVAPSTEMADGSEGVRPAPTTGETDTTSNSNTTATPNEVARNDDNGASVSGARPAPTTNTTTAEVSKGFDSRRLTQIPLSPNRNVFNIAPATPKGRATVTPETTGGVVTFVDAGHNAAAEDALPTVASSSFDDDGVAEAAALLDPEDEAVSRHVERAQVLLRSFKNTRAAEGEGDLAYERELSRKLLEENISLQLDADADGNKKAKKVLSQLEPYLNDIANLRDQPARGELRSIKERMEKQEIIAALHVYDD